MSYELQQSAEDRNARLDDYLDRVVAPLVDDVPLARRRELRAELGAHLDALVDAHLELGSTPEEALAAAIKQFGSPRQVGKYWLREWRRERKTPPDSALHTAAVGLLCFLPASLLAWVANNAATTLGSNVVGGVLIFNTLLIPLVAGLITGMLTRTRHGYGAVLGCGAAAMLCAIIAACQSLAGIHDEGPGFPVVALAMAQLLFWLPIAAAAGALGGSLRQKLRVALGRWATNYVLSLK
jgi:hypothetical protein